MFSVLYKPVMTGANCSDTGGLPAISCDTKDAGEEERKCWYWTRERGYWTPFVSLRYTRSNIGGNNQCEGNYINRWACRIMGVGWLDWEKMQTWWHKYMYRQVARRLEESGDFSWEYIFLRVHRWCPFYNWVKIYACHSMHSISNCSCLSSLHLGIPLGSPEKAPVHFLIPNGVTRLHFSSALMAVDLEGFYLARFSKRPNL